MTVTVPRGHRSYGTLFDIIITYFLPNLFLFFIFGPFDPLLSFFFSFTFSKTLTRPRRRLRSFVTDCEGA